MVFEGPAIMVPIFAVSFGIPFVVAPLARAISKRIEKGAAAPDPALQERLASIERNVDVIAVEVEKLAEGQRFVTKLLAERPGVGLVFMSGYPNEAREMQEFAGGSGEFLQKPFGPGVLVEKVRALIARRSQRSLST